MLRGRNEIVSVIIPVYNREGTIERAIQSVLLQTYKKLDVVVIDDCSTDATREIVRSINDKRIRLICQNEKRGANAARNRGMAESKGEYIAFQDSDDEWLPEKIEIQIRFMKEHAYRASYCPYNLYEKSAVCIVPFDYMDVMKYQADLRQILARQNVVSTQTLIIKRELMELFGNRCFDEQMPRWQDYEFVIRLSKYVEIGYINKPLVNVYRSMESISSDKKNLYAAVALLIRKHADFLEIDGFLENFIKEYDIMADTGKSVIDGLNLIQEALDDTILENDVNIKDRFIAYIVQQAAKHKVDEQRECAFYMKRLQNQKFIIYGAGKLGQEVYQRLEAKGLYPKCFIVTECQKRKYIKNIPVISIDDNKDRDSVVIIAISREYQLELKRNLMDRNYKLFFTYHGVV